MKNRFRYAIVAGAVAATVFSFALLGLSGQGSNNLQVKADPNEATVVFDASHRLSAEQISDKEFNWPTSSGGYVTVEFQSVYNTPDAAPEGAFYSLTSTAPSNYQFYLRFRGIKGLKNIAWNVSTTETAAGANLKLWERSAGYGACSNPKNLETTVYANPSGSITDFVMVETPYYYEFRVADIPVGEKITINSLTLTYDIDLCKAA